MTRPIEHIATVVRAGDGVVEVELTAQSACASCHARMACGMGESTRKRIEIATPEAPSFTAGERVTVSVERNMGMTAVLWAYVVPFVVLLGALVGRAGLHCCGQGCRSLDQFVGIRVGAIEGAPLLRDILQPEPHIGLIQLADQRFGFRNGLLQSRLFRVGKGGGVPCLGLLQGGPGLVQRI